MRFIIDTSPWNRVFRSAGHRVLHYLVHILNKAGYEAYSGQNDNNPEWIEPFIPHEQITSEDIIIYSDWVGWKNHLKGSKIVRYILLQCDDPCQIHKDCWRIGIMPANELMVLYKKEYVDQLKFWQLKEEHYFQLPSIEPGLFHPAEKTIDSVYYIGKGLWAADKITHKLLPEIKKQLPDNCHWIEPARPETRQGLALLLGKLKRLYTFDWNSAICDEAFLSDCEVYYITPKDFGFPQIDISQIYLKDRPPIGETIEEAYIEPTKIFAEDCIAFFNREMNE